MALTTQENVLIIAPELSDTSDAAWTLRLADVSNFVSATVFGSKTEIAARNWVAHRLSLDASGAHGNVSGPITKEKVGDVIYEYARTKTIAKSDMDYGRTKYGRDFLTIRNSSIPLFKVVVPGV